MPPRRWGAALRSWATPRGASTSTSANGSSRPVTVAAARAARSWSPSAGSAERVSTSSRSRPPTPSTASASSAADQPVAGWATWRTAGVVSGRHSASLCRSRSSSVVMVSSGSDAVVGAVEGKRGRLAVDERLQVHRPAPDELDVGQGVGRLVQAQLDARVLVLEQQLPAVAVVAVYYIYPRFSEVRQAE